MIDYLKIEKKIEISNQRRAMNVEDYKKHYQQVEEILSGYDWKSVLDEMFKLK